MKLPEYDTLDATALADLVRGGDLSPTELLEAAIERVEARNPALNAVVSTLYDRARARVDDLPDGPFKGVPFLLKDLKIKLAGTVTTNSTRLDANTVADRSSVLAERYEAAGLQIIGKTNTPEFGLLGITEPQLRGPCRNPWNPEHTPCGSSGGAASAVGARMVPVAHGGDGGGSIRIPASACGLFGLKPTRGRVTMAPFFGEGWGGFVQEHVLARTVRDSAGLLDVADPPTPGEWYSQPPKARPWVEEVGADPGTLKIAFDTAPLFAGDPDPDCIAAVESTVALLEELGHTVVPARPPFPKADMVRAYLLTVASGIGWFVSDAARRHGRRPRAADFEPETWVMALIGSKTTAEELVGAQFTMQRAAREIAAFFETYDVFVNPTLGRPPAKVGELAMNRSERFQVGALSRLPVKRLLDVALDGLAEGRIVYTPNTQLFNQTGQPAMSMPLHWNDAGLPIGVQFAAPFGDEATLFRLAGQLEEARPWTERLPPVC